MFLVGYFNWTHFTQSPFILPLLQSLRLYWRFQLSLTKSLSIKMANDPQAIGKGFCGHYYQTFDGNRSGLANLFVWNLCSFSLILFCGDILALTMCLYLQSIHPSIYAIHGQTDQSMITYEGSQHQGRQSIMNKLSSLSFKTVKHETKTMDVQPSGKGGLLVIVTGDIYVEFLSLFLLIGINDFDAMMLCLQVDGSKNGIKFCEIFNLMKGNGNSFWIHNLVFRLNYCWCSGEGLIVW